MEERRALGLGSGVGLVASSMIGVGVLASAGWAAGVLGPSEILLSWLVGGAIALAGARAYAELATAIPRSGGEYRYLTDLLHPVAGEMAGWASLVLGFAAPMAFCGAMADAYGSTLTKLPANSLGITLIVATTLLALASARATQRVQDALAFSKLVLFAGFIGVGLWLGSREWPSWRPPIEGDVRLADFFGQLLWVAVAYSGWNTAAYAAEEFREPRRTVPRAMLLGTLLVIVLYLLVNWVFVANLDAATLAQWRESGGDSSRTTLGHLIVSKLVGPVGAGAMSAFVVLSMASSACAFTIAGPRVLASMASDRRFPRSFEAPAGVTPVRATLLQGALALAMLVTHSFDLLVENVGAVLTFTTALTTLALVRARARPPRGFESTRLASLGVLCGLGYFAASAWTLWAAAAEKPMRLLWIGLLVGAALVAHLVRRLRGQRLGQA
ncbi:MAG: APC family permease [Planctomycetaceae bacterium]|nr:APC family permease [Planctomycetaceae bacterium]